MRSLTPAFVGRHEERRVLDQSFEAAHEGKDRFVILEGLAGSGKSRLVEHARAEASRRGFLTVLGMAGEGQEGAPYGLLLDAFRRCVRDTPGSLPAWFDPRSAWTDLVNFRPASALQGPHHAFHEISEALKRCGRPVFLVMEDLHWADRASLEILDWLIREQGERRILLLATCRSEGMAAAADRTGQIHRLLRRAGVVHLQLNGLSLAETRELVDATLPGHADAGFLARQLHRRTKGSPLFLEELLRRILADDSGFDAPLPVSFREAVRGRLTGLSREDLRLLQLASVIGDEFDLDTLAYLTRRGNTGVIETLARLSGQQLVRSGPDCNAFRFWHTLTREVLYEQLLLPDRRALHRRIAQRWHAEVAGSHQSSDLGYHLEKAGEEADAARHYTAAAERAAALGAFDEAFAHGERAFAFCREDRGPKALQVSRFARMAGHIGAALEYCAKAQQILGAADAPQLRAEVLLHEADLHWLKGDGHRAADVLRVVRKMRTSAGNEADAPAWAWLLAREAQRACLESRWPDVWAPADEAIAMSRRLQLPEIEAHVLVTSGLAEAVRCGFEQGLDALRRGRALAEQQGCVEDICRSYVVEVDLRIHEGDFAAACRAAVEGAAHARRAGAPVILYPALAATAVELLWKTGSWQQALNRIPETERLVNEQPSDLVRCYFGSVLAGIAVARDRLEEAAWLLAEARKRAETIRESQWVLPVYLVSAQLALAAGKPVEAVRGTREAWKRVSSRDPEAAELLALGLEAECACRNSGGGSAVGDGFTAAKPAGTGSASTGDFYASLAAGFRALLAQKPMRAVNAFRDAAARAVTMTCPAAEARAREWLAKALQDRGGTAAKHEAIQQRGRARAILAAIPGRRRETGSPFDMLSERERDVARLVAEGLANKQVGIRLTISERTVAVHLGRIFEKVGVNSRHRLAALVTAAGGL